MGIKYTFISLVMASLLMSCNKGVEGQKKSDPVDMGNAGTSSDPVNTGADCICTSVMEILSDAKTVISNLDGRSNKLIRWNIANNKIISQLYYPHKIDSISTNGDYLLRKVSKSKFQLVSLGEATYRFEKSFFIRSVTPPKVKFSSDSTKILTLHTPFYSSSKKKVSVFDIKSKKYLGSTELKFIKFFEYMEQEKSIFLGQDNGFDKKVVKVNIETNKVEWEIYLPLLRGFTHMSVHNSTLLIRVAEKYEIYDSMTGHLIDELKNLSLQSVSNDGNFAVFVRNTYEVVVIDLKTGDEIFTKPVPTDVFISNCKLNEDTMTLFCSHKKFRESIVAWDLGTGRLLRKCM